MSSVPTVVRLGWPVGPYYTEWVTGSGVHAWVHYKLKSAEWYLEALEAVGREVPEFDRYVGVEMAVDGALAALCSAFDASLGGLIEALEVAAGLPEPKRTPPHRFRWTAARDIASNASITVPSLEQIAEALAGSRGSQPKGWLAQLQRVRNRAVHYNTLTRHFFRGSGTDGCLIDVPTLGPTPLMDYLRSQRIAVQTLCDAMLDDVDKISNAGAVGVPQHSLTVSTHTISASAKIPSARSTP